MRLLELPIDSILIEDRARKDMGDMYELSQDIKANGLICPVAVRTIDGTGGYRLLAGARRLTACKALGWENIACRIYDRDLSEREMCAVELSENFYRKAMRPDEEALLRDQIHSLLVEEKGEKIARRKDASGQSMADTADLLGISGAQMGQDVKLAKIIKSLPDIDWSKFKSKKEMLNFVKTMATNVDRNIRAEKAVKTLGVGDRALKRLFDAYVVGSFFEKIKQVPDSTFHFIEMDPPYAIGLPDVKKNYSYEGYNEITPEKYPAFMQKALKECYRVAKANSWMIVWFASDPWFESMYNWINASGWTTTRQFAVWFKSKTPEDQAYGQEYNPLTDLASGIETFFYCRKGKPQLGKPGRSNGFSYRPLTKSEGKYHPTQRPIELMLDVVQTFSRENDRILVPFAGSGMTMVASAIAKRLPLGFDISDSFKDGYTLECKRLLGGENAIM